MQAVIALDIGHSTVKGTAFGSFAGHMTRREFIFPSIAVPAVRIEDEVEAARVVADTVTFEGRPWFFGKTAEIQSMGVFSTGLTDDWIETREHSVLFLGALARLRQMGLRDIDGAMFVLGLPTRHHASKKERLKAILSKFVPNSEILVAPQPMGALQADMMTENGVDKEGRSLAQESIAVVEVGAYTTDFLLLQQGQWTQNGCDSSGGVHLAAEHLGSLLAEKHGLDLNVVDCQDALVTGKTLNFGKMLDVSAEVEEAKAVLVSNIIDNADRLFSPVARKLHKVLVAGGGAPLVAPGLKAKWPHVEVVPNARMAISDGFCRMGMSIMRARAKMNAELGVRVG